MHTREKWDTTVFLCRGRRKRSGSRSRISSTTPALIWTCLYCYVFTNQRMRTSLPAHTWTQTHMHTLTHAHTRRLSHKQYATNTLWFRSSVWLQRLLCDCQIAGQHQRGSLMHFDNILAPLPLALFLLLNRHFMIHLSCTTYISTYADHLSHLLSFRADLTITSFSCVAIIFQSRFPCNNNNSFIGYWTISD